MLSIQGFCSLVCTFLLLLILGLLLKLYRAVQNWEQRPVENNWGRLLLRDEEKHNNSVPCNRKQATEQDDY